MTDQSPNLRMLDRRGFLKVAGAGVMAALAHSRMPSALAASLDPTRPWSDPAAWGGRVPGPRDIAFVSGSVRLDRNARVAGVVISPTGSLSFDPELSLTLESTGNVVVRGGQLVMRPARSQVVHRLTFVDVNESRFVGGGMDPKDTDVGLWVVERGIVDASGTHRLAWTRAAGTVRRGATSITLEEAPAGWQVGDEIVLTPTLPPTVKNSYNAYDVAKVAGVAGNVVTLQSPTVFDHPFVSVGRGRSFGCEVLNVTRNVVIGGTPTGRSHVLFSGDSGPQRISCVRIEHVGPQKEQGLLDKSGRPLREPVLGRYGFHFHMAGDSTRGSIIDGVVVTKCGSHAFVLHNSNGVALRECIAHDTATSQYWWDTPKDDLSQRSNDNLYDRCVGSAMRVLDNSKYWYRQASFDLQRGSNNAALGCVAVGNGGIDSSAGFVWGEIHAEGVWRFENNLTHNCRAAGAFVWQNGRLVHFIDGLVSYHNGGPGITHGAYRNAYIYRNCISFGNFSYPLHLWASGAGFDTPARFEDCLFDGQGRVDYAVAAPGFPTLPSLAPTLFLRCEFRGARKACVGNFRARSGTQMLIDLVDCSYDRNEFLFGTTHKDTRWRVQDVKHGSIMLMPRGSGGRYTAAWDAEVKQIAPFVVAPASAPAPASQEPAQSGFACRL